jgi:hypothetical protein
MRWSPPKRPAFAVTVHQNREQLSEGVPRPKTFHGALIVAFTTGHFWREQYLPCLSLKETVAEHVE